MSKLSTAQTNLAAKTSKITALQEANAGALHPLYSDPDWGITLVSTAGVPAIRFPTAAQANDFIASTGPNGRWPV